MRRKAAVLGVIEGAFEVVDVGCEPNATRKHLSRRAAEDWQCRQREVDLRERAARPVILHPPEEFRRQVIGIAKVQERALWIDARYDRARFDVLAGRERDTNRAI